MHLKLAIGGSVIASVPLNSDDLSNLEYVYTKRCLLEESCSLVIASQKEKPIYYIEASSRMNAYGKK
jgi:hypothetical protein